LDKEQETKDYKKQTLKRNGNYFDRRKLANLVNKIHDNFVSGGCAGVMGRAGERAKWATVIGDRQHALAPEGRHVYRFKQR